QRELEEVMLPKASIVKKDEPPKERLVVNVFHEPKTACHAYSHELTCRDESHWHIGINGLDYTGKDRLKKKITDEANPNRRVMIRADALSPYGLTQAAMQECAVAGIFQVEVGAARPPENH